MEDRSINTWITLVFTYLFTGEDRSQSPHDSLMMRVVWMRNVAEEKGSQGLITYLVGNQRGGRMREEMLCGWVEVVRS